MAAAAGIAPLLSPIDADLSDSQFGRIQGVAILFAILPTVVVALRFLARKLSKAGLWWDDWTILAALIVSWGTSICMLIGMELHHPSSLHYPAHILTLHSQHYGTASGDISPTSRTWRNDLRLRRRGSSCCKTRFAYCPNPSKMANVQQIWL